VSALARLVAVSLTLSWSAGAAARSDPGDDVAGTPEIDACPDHSKEDEHTTDKRVEEHYDRGRILYAQGDYVGAIEEFVAAYCHGRYPSILVDIGQAYERLVDYEKAVAYLERYIADAPRNEHNTREIIAYRTEVLRNLPARLRVATVPAGAQVSLTTRGGLAAQARANAPEPILVRQGTYELKIEMPGYEVVRQTIRAQIGQPYSYYFRLDPQKGQARIFVSPEDARIFVDDKMVGIGSYIDTLAIGTYTVTVEAPRRPTVKRPLEVRAERPAELLVKMPGEISSGRRQLLVFSTIASGLFGAGALSSAFTGNDSVAGTIGGIVGVGAGFGGAYFGIPHHISVGTSSYLIGASFIGAAQGGMLAAYYCAGATTSCEDNVVANVVLLSGVAGLGFAAATTNRVRLSGGDAALINSGALWGTVAGGLFWSAFDRELEDSRLGAGLFWLGLTSGVVTGAALAARLDYSRGHVAIIDLGAIAGIIAGSALANVFPETGNRSGDPEADAAGSERQAHLALGGMAAGLITTWYLTGHWDVPGGSGTVAPTVSAGQDRSGAWVPTFGLAGTF
jgi:hypothetical protein